MRPCPLARYKYFIVPDMHTWYARARCKIWQRLSFVAIFLALGVAILPAQETGGRLMTQDEVYNLIKREKQEPDRLEKTLHERGVDFDLNPEIEKRMKKAGASDEILQAIWGAGPTVRNFKGAVLMSATGAPLTCTYKEAMGYKTLEQASDPDTKIRMAMEFAQTFPTSEPLSYVFTQAAAAFQRKGDFTNAAKTGRRSLEPDANNTYSLLIVANSVSEPSMVRDAPDNGAKPLEEAQTDAQRGLDLLPKRPSRPGETPEQFAERKAGIESSAHSALGSVAMQQDKSIVPIEEFNKAISLSQHPKPSLYFRLGEIYSKTGDKQKAFAAFSKAAELGKGTVIETYATRSIKEIQEN